MSEETKTEETVLTPEELQQQGEEFARGLFDNEVLSRHAVKPKEEDRPPLPEEPKTEEPPKEEAKEEPKEETPEPEVKRTGLSQEATEEPEPEPEPPAKTEPAPTLDEDELAEKVAEKLAERKEKPGEADPYEKLGEEERRQVEALKLLSQSRKYQGRDLAKEAVEFWKAEDEYKAQWRKSNPGKKWNPDDEDHADFYEAHEPEVDDKDVAAAERELIKQEAIREAKGEAAREVQALREEREAEKAWQQAKPIIEQNANLAVTELVTAAVPEFAEIIPDGKITPDAIKKMEEIDPEAVEVLDQEAQVLKALVREIDSMAELGRYFQFDSQKMVRMPGGRVVMPHAEIYNTGSDLEERILRKPAAERVHDGKHFIPRAELQARVRAIQSGPGSNETKTAKINNLFDKTWTIGAHDIKAAFVAKSAKNVQEVLGLAKKREARALSKLAKNDGKPVEQTTQQTPAKPASKAPPSLSSVSDIVDSKIPGGVKTQTSEEVFAKSLFS